VSPETVVYLFVSGCILLLFKIVWDWLKSLKNPNGIKNNGIKEICQQRMKMFDNEICRLYERLEKIEEKLEIALDKINKKMDEKFELLIKMLTQERS